MMQKGKNKKKRLLKKRVSVYETESSIAVISVKYMKEEAQSKSRKHKKEIKVSSNWCEISQY